MSRIVEEMEHESDLAQLRRLVEFYRRPLGLDRWDLEIVEGAGLEDDAEALCHAQPEYRRATVYFDLAKIPERKRARYVLHEMIHCLTWPMAAVAEPLAKGGKFKLKALSDAHEFVTTDFEHILFALIGEPE